MRELTGGRLADATAARIGWRPAISPSRGDLSTDAALLAGRADADFARRLAESLSVLAPVRAVRVVPPGFINLTYTDAALDGVLAALLEGRARGPAPAGATAQPPGPMRRADPDFMVHYAHARCRSVLRAAAGITGLDWDNPAMLVAAARGRFLDGPPRALLTRIDHWMRIEHSVVPRHGKAGITLFLRDFSRQFDRMWMQSGDDATLRLLHPGQRSRSLANLALVLATADVIRSALGLQGLDAAEEIR